MSDKWFPARTGLECLLSDGAGEVVSRVKLALSNCFKYMLFISPCTCLLPAISAATLGGADLPKVGETLTVTNDSTLRILPGESALFHGTIEIRGWNIQFSLVNEGTLIASNGIVTVSGGPGGRAAIHSAGTLRGGTLQINALGATPVTVDLTGDVTLEDMRLMAQLDSDTNTLLTVFIRVPAFQVSRVMFVSNGPGGGIQCDVKAKAGQTFLVNEWRNGANYGGSITHRFHGEGAVLLRQAAYSASGWSHGIQSRIQTECELTVTAHALTCDGARVPPFVLAGGGQVYATNAVSFGTVENGVLRVVPQPVLVASPVSSGFMKLQVSACFPDIAYWIECSNRLEADSWAGLLNFSSVTETNVQVDVRAGAGSAFYRCRFE